MKYGLSLVVCCVLWTVTGPEARANGGEDLFGLGTRVKAMGSAGTALANDYSAVYYNPARLALCNSVSLNVGYYHMSYGLSVDAPEDALAKEPVDNRDGYSIGLCVPLPFRLGFGLNFSQNLQDPMTFSQTSVSPTARFVLYGRWLDSMAIMAGLGGRPLSWLSLGVGVSILGNSELLADNDIPIASQGELRDEWGWRFKPTAAVYAGVNLELSDEMSVGLTYRSALYHKLDTTAKTSLQVAGVVLDFDMFMQSVAWYSPEQLALGLAVRPGRRWVIAADLTWYNWSAYPGPQIQATPAEGVTVADIVDFPAREKIGFRDVFIPRFGVEFNPGEWLALRLGYSYRFSPAPIPRGLSNNLDGDTHAFSAGLGTKWSVGKDEPGVDGQPTRHVPVIGLDVYATAYIMPDRIVVKDPAASNLKFSFGGQILDAGLSLSLQY